MATISDVKLMIAGTGHVFYADTDVDIPEISTIRFNEPTTYGSLVWVGDTSAENMIEFSEDGGEATTKRTWDRKDVVSVYSDTTVTGTINSVNLSRETFTLGFSGSTYNEATKSHRVGTGAGATERALFVLIEDGVSVAGLYLPKVAIKGAFPKFSIEEFTEIPLNITLLGSDTQTDGNGTPLRFEWFEPRNRAVSPAPEGA